MKICFYSPYLGKHFGGGEKYLLDVAQIYANHKHQVFMAIRANLDLNIEEIKKKYSHFFNLNLDQINFITTPVGTSAKFLKKLLWTRQFQCLYYQTDGSLFFSLARKNILHIQIPLRLYKRNLIEKLKLFNWSIKNTNSFYTKKVTEKYWNCKINLVHHPMADIGSTVIDLDKKEKIILTVGRFFNHLHCKKQDCLVDFFNRMLKKYPQTTKGWKFVLVGHIEDEKYARFVMNKVHNQDRIKIYFSASRNELINFYQKAAIYWHAAGFQVDQNLHPERVEHFGISTLEAMAYGCVPIVIGKGGQVEVLGRKLKDLSWISEKECLKKTFDLIKSSKKLKEKQKMSLERAKKFSFNNFETKALEMLK